MLCNGQNYDKIVYMQNERSSVGILYIIGFLSVYMSINDAANSRCH